MVLHKEWWDAFTSSHPSLKVFHTKFSFWNKGGCWGGEGISEVVAGGGRWLGRKRGTDDEKIMISEGGGLIGGSL